MINIWLLQGWWWQVKIQLKYPIQNVIEVTTIYKSSHPLTKFPLKKNGSSQPLPNRSNHTITWSYYNFEYDFIYVIEKGKLCQLW